MKIALLLACATALLGCGSGASLLSNNAAVPYDQSYVPQSAAADGAAAPFIANGHAATLNQFPYQVSVRSPQGAGWSICGGSLISASWVLTAAHCTVGQSQFNLRFGSINLLTGGQAQTSRTVHNHPSFSWVTLNNDISVVHVPSALSLAGPAIRAVRLPTASQAAATFAGLQTTASGWGETGPNTGAQQLLRWVHKRVITNAQCAQTFGPRVVVGHVICTLGYTQPGNQGVCGGDSGGPLVLQEGGVPTLVGVVAFAAHPNIGGCSAGHPSGYMRTASFLSWIMGHTGIAIRT